jgi:DNA-binding Lrp family transcriptional regulator
VLISHPFRKVDPSAYDSSIWTADSSAIHCVLGADHLSIDTIDRRIVALLREDARRSFQDIGRRVSLSPPAVKRRVDRLEAAGVIRGYTAVVDPARFGWTTEGFVSLYTEGRVSAAQVRAAAAAHPEVVAAYTVAGQASAILHVRAADTKHLEDVLERIRDSPGVSATQTQVVLSTLFERPFATPPNED